MIIGNTLLKEEFIATLVASLEKDGVQILEIHDEGPETVLVTSLCTVRMFGIWTLDDFRHAVRNEYYRFLNERFDRRVELLKSNGYQYYKEYACFAKSETSARNHCGIHTGVVMHENDFLFNFNLE